MADVTRLEVLEGELNEARKVVYKLAIHRKFLERKVLTDMRQSVTDQLGAVKTKLKESEDMLAFLEDERTQYAKYEKSISV